MAIFNLKNLCFEVETPVSVGPQLASPVPGPLAWDGNGDLDSEGGAKQGRDEKLKVVGHTHSQAREIKEW